MARGLKVAVLCACALPGLWLWARGLSNQLGSNPAEALIRGLGDWTLRLLVLTLLVTPLRQWTGWVDPVRWRRGLGLWTFAYATQHALVYVWLDMGGVWPDVWADVLQRPFIWIGVLAWLALVPLALTSTNAAIRAMGGARWRALHRLVYAIAGLAVLHFYWMRLGKNDWGEVVVYAALLSILLGGRAWRRWRTAVHS